MGEITNDRFILIDMHLYVELRDCTNTRLIIINGQRGGEPSILTISEWKEAENDVWLDKKMLKGNSRGSNKWCKNNIPNRERNQPSCLTHDSKRYY